MGRQKSEGSINRRMNKEELEKEVERLRKENEQLKEENKELKKILTVFINPHTPPSKQFFKKKYPRASKKLGAPLGHRGATRKMPQPTETIKHFLTNCPNCNNFLKKLLYTEERIIEEIPEPQPIKVTKHIIGFYNCKNCGIVAAKTGLPNEGCFGKNVLAQTTLMKYDDRLPARKVANTLNRTFLFEATHSTVLNIVQRVVKAVQHVYGQLKIQIRNFFNVYIDETGIKVQGKTFWIWIFTTLTTTIFVIRKSRHCKVVKEVLGENFEGVINCDGWETYKTYKNNNDKVLLQRCWAHAKREVEAIAEKYDEIRPLFKWFQDIYIMVCKARESGKPLYRRAKLKEKCENELRQWLDVTKSYKELKTVRTKIENGFEHWFTCIIHPEVEPTNNRAERMLREQVVIRKITGTLRNEKGTTANEVMMSLITTWKQQNKNPFLELRALL
ncbi:MAG: IS66 family element transposase [Stygiobacter sp.]|nr:MAG: IS66 family element transposase [Stygiobacter sp.]